MGVEVSEHHTHTRRLRIMHVDPCAAACGPVLRGPTGRHPNRTPSAQRFATPQWMAHPVALGCIVLACDPPSPPRPGRVDLTKQWLAGCIHPDDGRASGVGPVGDLQPVLHVRHAGSMGLGWHAPRCDLPQRAIVFVHAWRIVSREARAPEPTSPSRSASTRTVQRPYPRGGSPPAQAIHRCATSPVLVTVSGRWRGRRGLRAASKLSSTTCCRTRWMVARLTHHAAAMASSVYRRPSGLASAWSQMRPWSTVRAAPLPDDTMCRSIQRSASVRVTRNLAMGALLLSHHNQW
jgi:hypothetical protein